MNKQVLPKSYISLCVMRSEMLALARDPLADPEDREAAMKLVKAARRQIERERRACRKAR